MKERFLDSLRAVLRVIVFIVSLPGALLFPLWWVVWVIFGWNYYTWWGDEVVFRDDHYDYYY